MKIQSEQKTNIFIKTYRSILKNGGILEIDQITKPYKEMEPALHRNAAAEKVDEGALIYSYLRLPNIMSQVKKVVIGQSDDIFEQNDYQIHEYKIMPAPARRRKMYFNKQTGDLCIIINSVTDVDDLVCLLTGMQIEWNKIRAKLFRIFPISETEDKLKEISQERLLKLNMVEELGMDKDLFARLTAIWDDGLEGFINEIYLHRVNFKVELLEGSYIEYKRGTQKWMDSIYLRTKIKDLKDRPIYFVSSNTHSVVNNITGFVRGKEDELLKYLEDNNMHDYLKYWENIKQGNLPGSEENFLWYVYKNYEKDHGELKKERKNLETELGIENLDAEKILDVNAQVIEMKKLAKSDLSSKLGRDFDYLADSDAVILNVDYPLGAGAYMLLATILNNNKYIKGVYILGKASFLNGKMGDVGLSTRVYDSHSDNTFFVDNVFDKSYFKEFKSGNVYEDQSAVTTRGTMLHPDEVLKEYFANDYTLLEMENGPYLNALFELSDYDRYPEGETINLINSPIDIGIIHYASDTVFTKAITLGTRSLGYDGVEPTYFSSLAILRRILEQEEKRLK